MISRFKSYIISLLFVSFYCIQASHATQIGHEAEGRSYFHYTEITSDTILLSITQAEQLFLENNLLLLAQKFEIQHAQALTRQARLWNNPEFSISEVNLRTIPASEMFDDLSGRPQQFSVEIEQLIRTAGKRSRLITMHQILAEQQEHVFDDVLRALKFELRSAFHELNFLIHAENLLMQEVSAIAVIIEAMKQQEQRGHISKAELLRLQSLLFSMRKELVEVETERINTQNELLILLHLDPATVIVPSGMDLLQAFQQIDIDPIAHLIDLAVNQRPDLIVSRKQANYFQADIAYQRSKAVPDISLGAMYDRWGGISENYIGFGLSVDLPVFDRNQGHIRAARLALDKQISMQQTFEHMVKNQVLSAWKTLSAYENLLREIDVQYIEQQESVFQQISRNYENRNIGLLEFLDYFNAYRESKVQYMKTRKDISLAIEELNYAVGMDVVGYEQ